MKQFLKFSNMHLFFPTVIACILAILAIALIIQRIRKCKREGSPFINLKGYRFFEPGYDKIKLWGSIVLFALYIASLEPMGFLWASMLFVTLFNILFADSIRFRVLFGRETGAAVDWKSLAVSAVIGVVASFIIWFVFYEVFNITLP